MIREWLYRRQERIAEQERATEKTRLVREQISDQWSEVDGLVGFSRNQRSINHLSQLFAEMHRGGH